MFWECVCKLFFNFCIKLPLEGTRSRWCIYLFETKELEGCDPERNAECRASVLAETTAFLSEYATMLPDEDNASSRQACQRKTDAELL